MKKLNLSKGFTLIELLTVIAIIGVISSVVFSSINTARSKARYSKIVSDMKQLYLAATMYNNEYGVYPTGVANIGGHPEIIPNSPFPNNFSQFLSPTIAPPCEWWNYTISTNGSISAVILREVTLGQIMTSRKSYWCIEGDCSSLYPLQIPIQQFTNKSITCDE
ncbi:MAG TPA: type II secretion system protein [Candidatus Paceibacterota bacterium]